MNRLLVALLLVAGGVALPGCKSQPAAPAGPQAETESPKDSPVAYKVLEDKTENNGVSFHVLVADGTRHDDVEALLGLVDAYLLAGKAGEAEQAARRALAASPSYWAVHNKLGVVLASRGRGDEAIGAFRRAVELAPGNARGLVNLGSALVVAGRLDEAAETLQHELVAPTGRSVQVCARATDGAANASAPVCEVAGNL